MYLCMCYLCSVPELRFIEPQGLTSDHVKELTEEVEKLAKEKVGEVRRGRMREREREEVHYKFVLLCPTLLPR